MLSDLLSPAVLRSNHVRLPSTSATKGGAGQVLRPGADSLLLITSGRHGSGRLLDVLGLRLDFDFRERLCLCHVPINTSYEFLFYPVVRITLWQWLWGIVP